ncbi:MAG: hypothetical protein NTZ11_12935 [Gammaproteobacteria bacterium]|nr:hypothetical protein [Gammaproteobacteria bacterium]
MTDSEKKRLILCREAYKIGNMAGAIEAFAILTRNKELLPAWLAVALRHFIVAATEAEGQPTRSAVRRWAKRHHADMRDYERWDLVRDGIDNQGLRFADGEVFQAAQVVLRRNETISVHSIERSYKRVQRLNKTEPLRLLWSTLLPAHPSKKKRPRAGHHPDEMPAHELSKLLDSCSAALAKGVSRAKRRRKSYP